MSHLDRETTLHLRQAVANKRRTRGRLESAHLTPLTQAESARGDQSRPEACSRPAAALGWVRRIVRHRLSDGAVSVLLDVSTLGSACNFLVAPAQQAFAISAPRSTSLAVGDDTRSLVTCSASLTGP